MILNTYSGYGRLIKCSRCSRCGEEKGAKRDLDKGYRGCKSMRVESFCTRASARNIFFQVYKVIHVYIVYKIRKEVTVKDARANEVLPKV